MGALVVLNAVCIGLSCDLEPDWRGWLIIDTVFAGAFLLELLVKLWVVGPRRLFLDAEETGWNVMELLIVAAAIFEVCLVWAVGDGSENGFYSVFRIFRVLRATRVARLIRLQVFQELTILVKGLLGGLRVLCWSLVVLFLPLYSMAVIFRETIGASDEEHAFGAQHFQTLGESLFTVFRCTVAGSCETAQGTPIFVLMSSHYGWGYGLLYALSVVFVSLGLFNVIAAIFVEQVIVGAKTSTMLVRRHRLRDKRFFAEKITELLKLIIDVEANAPGKSRVFSIKKLFEKAEGIMITPDLFERVRLEPRFGELLTELDVPDEEQFCLFETLDANRNDILELDELIDGIGKLRGEPRRSDIVHLTFMLKSVQTEVRYIQAQLASQQTAFCQQESYRWDPPSPPVKAGRLRSSGNARVSLSEDAEDDDCFPI